MIKHIFISLAVGALASATTWLILRRKYQEISEKEINEMRDFYKHKYESSSDGNGDKEEKSTNDEDSTNAKVERHSGRYPWGYEKDQDIISYSSTIHNNGYEKQNENAPYKISADIFGTDGYEPVSLTFYEDGVLADELNEAIYDVENTVGPNFKSWFDDADSENPYCIWVRNPSRKCDYEITIDYRNFSDLYGGHYDERDIE